MWFLEQFSVHFLTRKLNPGFCRVSWEAYIKTQVAKSPSNRLKIPASVVAQFESKAVAKREQLAAAEERRLQELEGRLAAKERAIFEQRDQLAQVSHRSQGGSH